MSSNSKLYRCAIGYYPMRSEPKHSSEMVSMILKDEYYFILDSNVKNWHKIRCVDDKYEGWVSIRKPVEVEETEENNTSILKSYPNQNRIIEIASSFLGTPYLWGGRSLLGIDCSGFSQSVYKSIGIQLPRDAYQQAEIGEPITDLQDSKDGDLVFFSENGTKISHVGILFWQNKELKIIHASNEVKIEKISLEGIFNEEIQELTLKPILVKRYLKI